MLFCRWSFSSPQFGGLRAASAGSAAKFVLQALLSHACAADASRRVVVIVFDSSWICRWPRPPAYERCSRKLALPFSAHGVVDMRPMWEMQHSNDKTVRKWTRGLLSTCTPATDSNEWSLERLLSAASVVHALSCLRVQMLQSLSCVVERQLAEVQGQPVAGDVGFEFDKVRIRSKGPHVDQHIFAYMCAAVEESSRHRCIGVSTDKASPCSGSLANTAISFPTNKLAVCCPQVKLCAVGILQQSDGC